MIEKIVTYFTEQNQYEEIKPQNMKILAHLFNMILDCVIWSMK